MFNVRLKELREEAKMTQSDLAKKLGASPQIISYWEKGRQPSFSTLCSIADLFNVSTDYLLGRSEFKNFADEDYYNFTVKRMGFTEHPMFPEMQNIVLDYLNPLIKTLVIFYQNNVTNDEERAQPFIRFTSVLDDIKNLFDLINDIYKQDHIMSALTPNNLNYNVNVKSHKLTLIEKLKRKASAKPYIPTTDEVLTELDALTKEMSKLNNLIIVIDEDIHNKLDTLVLSLNKFIDFYKHNLQQNLNSSIYILDELSTYLGGNMYGEEERE